MPESHFVLPVCIKPHLARNKIKCSKSFSILPAHHLLTFSVTDEKSGMNLILGLLYVISDNCQDFFLYLGVLRVHHNTHNQISFSFILFNIWKSLEFLKHHVFLNCEKFSFILYSLPSLICLTSFSRTLSGNNSPVKCPDRCQGDSSGLCTYCL